MGDPNNNKTKSILFNLTILLFSILFSV